MMFRDWWQSRPSADNRGRRGRGIETLEPRSVLSASGSSFYSLEPLELPPTPLGHPRDAVTRGVSNYVEPLGMRERGELLTPRYESHHTVEPAPIQWQVTIVILPTLGALADRGSSAFVEGYSFLRSSIALLTTIPSVSYSLRFDAARESHTLLVGSELESLTATLASTSSWSGAGFSSLVSTRLESSDDQLPAGSATSAVNNPPSQRLPTGELPRPTGFSPAETDGLVEVESTNSPLHLRRKVARAGSGVFAANAANSSPHVLDYPVAGNADLLGRRTVRLPVDVVTQPSGPESVPTQSSTIWSSGEADLIELLAADVAAIMPRDTLPRLHAEHFVRLGPNDQIKPEGALQLYQAFEIGGDKVQEIKNAVAAAESPATRPIRTAEDQE
jgi:hypothetical protein